MPPEIRGPVTSAQTVFSSQEKPNKRAAIRKFEHRLYWLVSKNEDGTVTATRLNKKNLPTKDVRTLTLKQLIENYTPEPDYYARCVFPMLHRVEETINRGDELREQNDHTSASYEYGNALDMDIDNVRANFGAALVFLAQGEVAKAEGVFNRLVRLDGTFEEEHKHLFNEFGISLRKGKMYKQAIAYYQRALQLTQEDENLHINIARALFEEGFFTSCTEHLLKSLKLCPGHPLALRFLVWMEAQECLPNKYTQVVQALVSIYGLPALDSLSGEEQAEALPDTVPVGVPEEEESAAIEAIANQALDPVDHGHRARKTESRC